MRVPLLASAALVLLALALSARPAHGGTLCGEVRDAATGAPVAHAGIFVRTPAGSYTGYYGASDEAGAFCIPGLPPGVYDLEILVDDYQVAYLRGIVVTGATDVTLPIEISRVWLALPWPNPANGEIHLQWTLPRPAGTRLLVLDPEGRLVHGWSSWMEPGVHSLTWDLRGPRGRTIAPGCYFVLLEAAGVRRVRTFLRVP